MAKLEFTTPLSSTGVRGLHVDLSNALDTGETLTGTSPTVTSSDTSLVTISATAVNTATLTNDDGSTVAAGFAVQWKATSVNVATGRVFYRVSWAVAAGGSADTHEIEQDLAEFVTE